MTKWVHDLGLGLGPIPTEEISREEFKQRFWIEVVEELSIEECKRRWPEAEKHVEPAE